RRQALGVYADERPPALLQGENFRRPDAAVHLPRRGRLSLALCPRRARLVAVPPYFGPEGNARRLPALLRLPPRRRPVEPGSSRRAAVHAVRACPLAVEGFRPLRPVLFLRERREGGEEE